MTPAAQTRTELREHLARELHDAVASELQAMLIEMEVLHRRGGVPPEIQDFQATVRRALSDLRCIVRELRDLPPDPVLVEIAIDRKVAVAARARRQRRELVT